MRLFIFSINQSNLNLHRINIKNMNLPKHLGLIILILLILISLGLIVYPMIIRPTGVVITSVAPNSPCEDTMVVGSTITGVGNKLIKNSDDFAESTKDLGGVITFVINGNPRSCNIPEGTELNVTVTNVKTEGIKLGTDIWGGMFYLFESKEFSQDLVNSFDSNKLNYLLISFLLGTN